MSAGLAEYLNIWSSSDVSCRVLLAPLALCFGHSLLAKGSSHSMLMPTFPFCTVILLMLSNSPCLWYQDRSAPRWVSLCILCVSGCLLINTYASYYSVASICCSRGITRICPLLPFTLFRYSPSILPVCVSHYSRPHLKPLCCFN